MDIVCPRLGRGPDAIVLVATIRALRHHGSGDLALGSNNLFSHVQHLRHYGPPIIVAINRFEGDLEADHQELRSICAAQGVEAVSCDPFGSGGKGCEALAELVATNTRQPHSFAPLYAADASLEEKLLAIVTKAYGGSDLVLGGKARKELEWLRAHGYGKLPVCVAKTQYSLSDDATLLNAPKNFALHVNGLRVSAGAGFIVAECGDILLMPGLGKSPAAQNIDVEANGKITGLF